MNAIAVPRVQDPVAFPAASPAKYVANLAQRCTSRLVPRPRHGRGTLARHAPSPVDRPAGDVASRVDYPRRQSVSRRQHSWFVTASNPLVRAATSVPSTKRMPSPVPAHPAAPAAPGCHRPAPPVLQAPPDPLAPAGICPALKSALSSDPFLTFFELTALFLSCGVPTLAAEAATRSRRPCPSG